MNRVCSELATCSSCVNDAGVFDQRFMIFLMRKLRLRASIDYRESDARDEKNPVNNQLSQLRTNVWKVIALEGKLQTRK